MGVFGLAVLDVFPEPRHQFWTRPCDLISPEIVVGKPLRHIVADLFLTAMPAEGSGVDLYIKLFHSLGFQGDRSLHILLITWVLMY